MGVRDGERIAPRSVACTEVAFEVQASELIRCCDFGEWFRVGGCAPLLPFWKGRMFVSQVLRFEDLGFELVAEDYYKVFFRDVEIGEFDPEPSGLDLCRPCLAFRRNDHFVDCRQTRPYSPEFEPDIVLIEPQPRHRTPSAWMILCTLGGSITLHCVAELIVFSTSLVLARRTCSKPDFAGGLGHPTASPFRAHKFPES